MQGRKGDREREEGEKGGRRERKGDREIKRR
jgi:hypothetical protein